MRIPIFLSALFIFSNGLLSQNSTCIRDAPFNEPFAHNQPWRINLTTGMTDAEDTCYHKVPDGDSLGFRWNLGMDGGGSAVNPFHFSDSSGHRLYRQGNLYVFYIKAAHPGVIGNIATAKSYLQTPFIAIDSLNQPSLSFDYHMFGSDIRSLVLQIREVDDTSWTTLDSLHGEQQRSAADHFKVYSTRINVPGDTIQIRFVGKSNSGIHCNTIIDNIKLQEAVPCPLPNRPKIAQLAADSVIISFDSPPANGKIQIAYGKVGLNINDPGLKSRSINTDTAIIRGLKPGYTYYVYYGTNCTGQNSQYSPYPLILRMSCKEVLNFPYVENFDDWMGDTIAYFNSNPKYSGVLSSCWRDNNRRVNTKVTSWTAGKKSLTSLPQPDNDRSGNGFFLMQKFDFQNRHYLKTPSIDLSSSTRPQLSYWFHAHSSSQAKFFVEINNGGGWRVIDSLQTPIQNTESDPWLQSVVNLDSFTDDTVQVRFFSNNSSFQNPSLVSLDEIHFREKPGCALAGEDSTVQLCDTLTSLPLDLLLDSNAYGGNWQDLSNSGALSPASVLDLTALPKDSAFPFRYVIPADSTCSADSATFTIIRNKAGCKIGLREYRQEPGLEIYPNPARDELHLHPAKAHAQWGRIALYSLQGQRLPVKLRKESEGGMVLSLQEVPAGVYLLEVELNGKWLQRKVVKE